MAAKKQITKQVNVTVNVGTNADIGKAVRELALQHSKLKMREHITINVNGQPLAAAPVEEPSAEDLALL